MDDPDKMKDLGSTQDSERKRKSEVEAAVISVSFSFEPRGVLLTAMLCQRVKHWFAYQSQSHNRSDTTWSHILQRLHESSNPKPRKRSTVQQFMLENQTLVDTAFVSTHGEARGMDGAECMNKRHDIAKRILTGEHKSQIPALEGRAQEHHEREVNQWSLMLEDIELAADVNM